LAEDIWEKSKYKVKVSLIDDSKPYDGKRRSVVAEEWRSEQAAEVGDGHHGEARKPIERNFDVPEVEPDEATY
jgi:hypothetical protein